MSMGKVLIPLIIRDLARGILHVTTIARDRRSPSPCSPARLPTLATRGRRALRRVVITVSHGRRDFAVRSTHARFPASMERFRIQLEATRFDSSHRSCGGHEVEVGVEIAPDGPVCPCTRIKLPGAREALAVHHGG